MRDEMLHTKLLAAQVIANLSNSLRHELALPPHHHAIGLVSADSDDVTYIALDEATKSADVSVVYAKSLYAGAKNASTRLAGEVIGILSGPNPDEVISGLTAAEHVIGSLGFYKADPQGEIIYLSHCVASAGSFLSQTAGVPQGQALSYLIAPPVEALVGLDAALKASDVRLASFFPPPSETNFAGGLLTGTQSACQAACEAFSAAVKAVAQQSIIPEVAHG